MRLPNHLEARDGRRLALVVAAGLVLSLGATVGLGYAAGWDLIRERLAHAEWRWLPVCGTAEALAYGGYMLGYRGIARIDDGPPLDRGRIAAIVASGFGLFVAKGGADLDYQALRDAGAEKREAKIRVLGLSSLEHAPLAIAACVSAVVLIVRGDDEPAYGETIPWAVMPVVGGALAFWGLRHRELLARGGGWRLQLANVLESVQMLRRLAVKPACGVPAFLGMAVYWFGDMLCLYAALAAVGAPPSVPALVIGYSVGYVLTRRTVPLAGAGVVETLLPGALYLAGTPFAAAVPAVFLYRLFNLWLALVPAVAGLGGVRRLRLRPAGEPGPA